MQEIQAEEYFELYTKHKDNLCVHASYTDVSGHCHYWSTDRQQWMTEWGFKNSDTPLLRAESETYRDVATHKYFIYTTN